MSPMADIIREDERCELIQVERLLLTLEARVHGACWCGVVWRGVVVLIEGNGMAWHGVAWPSMVYPVLVAGRWDLNIKGEFESVARHSIISRGPTYPL